MMTIKPHIETDEEYIKRTTRIDMDYIHSALQECLNGNVDQRIIKVSLELINKLKTTV